ncbi:MAG TPA: DUF1648 domain-containing protein [Casimicrobiaceae bacterium]|nr:DUF1648 domain-containing protein [Casimicrobiaceae bacterium]
MNRFATMALIVVLIACGAVIAATLPDLPDVVASHFGATGGANGWSERNTYALIILGAAIGAPLLIAGLSMLPSLAPRVGVKLPHREYWLAPERRERTLAVLQGYACGIAAATALLVTALHLMTVHANLHPPPRLAVAPLIAVLGAYIIVVTGLALAKLRHFRTPN